jgi:isopentenyl diphosphate isomerase/L-lactate dehydrogenase-like FMN-dependent dehydrogenase
VPEFLTLQEMALAARRRLAPEVWDYLSGGSESETTLARNRQALDSLAFRPRVLRDVSAVTLSSSLLGQPLSLPVILAPIGSLALLDSGAALSVAKAAEASGTTSFVSTMSQPKMETVAAAVSIGLTFQLYVRGDEAWIMNMIKRAEDAGFRALCLTVDTANYGRRERDLMNRFSPVSAVDRSNLEGPTGPAAGADQAKLTWDSLARIRKSTALPLILKGVMTAEDAQLAVEHG